MRSDEDGMGYPQALQEDFGRKDSQCREQNSSLPAFFILWHSACIERDGLSLNRWKTANE
jgi:hypothetical protein